MSNTSAVLQQTSTREIQTYAQLCEASAAQRGCRPLAPVGEHGRVQKENQRGSLRYRNSGLNTAPMASM